MAQRFPSSGYLTGFGTTASLIGRPDVGLLTGTEMLDNARRIVSAVDVPVIADADLQPEPRRPGRPEPRTSAHSSWPERRQSLTAGGRSAGNVGCGTTLRQLYLARSAGSSTVVWTFQGVGGREQQRLCALLDAL